MPVPRPERFPLLAKSLQVGPCTFRNRMILGPHQTQFGGADGLPTQRLGDYLLARARGGVGAMIVEGGVVLPNSLREPTVLRAYREEAVECWRPILRPVKDEGVPVIGQLFHSGRQASGYSNREMPLWAPSAIACPLFREIPKAMDREDIATLIDAYVRSARQLVAAGFDGIEVQACHGYLLNEFLSPSTNKRTDEYGGPLENRMRLLMQVLEAVRGEIGRERALGVRHGTTELVAGGIELEESWLIAQQLEQSGLIDYLSLSQGVRQTQEFIRAPMFMKPAYAAEWAGALKRELTLPVFTAGRMVHPAVAESVLERGFADAVVMVRELVADPEFARKALSGRVDELRACVGINECVFNVGSGKALSCAQNAEVGQEGRNRLAPATRKRRVVIIGGGPAGLEAARVAAVRGHEVTLFEESGAIGGALKLAVRTPGREELRAVIDYFAVQLEKLNVNVRLRTRASADNVLPMEPDLVILATGAAPLLPPSPLLPALSLTDGARLVSYEAAFERSWRAGQRVVLFDGELHALALSAADQLAEQGVLVSLVTTSEKPGMRLDAATQKMWFERLYTRGVEFLPYRSLRGAGAGFATVRHSLSGREETVPCDAVVYAQARVAKLEVLDELKGQGLTVKLAGDCLAPRSLSFAVSDGLRLAAAID